MKLRKFKIKIKGAHVAPGRTIMEDFKEAWKLAEKGRLDDQPYDLVIIFPDISYLSKIFSPERLRLIMVIRESKPESVYQLAKILERQLRNVQKDVHELAELGIIQLKKTRKKGQKREYFHPEYNWDGFDIAV